MFLVHVCILLTYNVEEADPSLGGGCVDLAHVCALVRVLYVPDGDREQNEPSLCDSTQTFQTVRHKE